MLAADPLESLVELSSAAVRPSLREGAFPDRQHVVGYQGVFRVPCLASNRQ